MMIDYEEIINIFLSIIHDEFIWLDKSYFISKEVRQIVIGLCIIREIPMLKYVNNVEVNCLTKLILDGRELKIDTIRDVDIRFVTMGISYKIYYRNREGSCASTSAYEAYQMVKENAEYDLCEILQRWLLDNVYT